MKRSIYITLLILFSQCSFAQTTIFSETFNSGSSNWTLNTSDAGSTAGTSGNYWVVNSSYTSLFGTTPSQPAAITGSPNSAYLHIRSSLTQNATFLAPADGNKFVKMNTGISTVGYTNVNLNFWYLCYGDAIATDAYYGKTYYSIDGGITWVQNPVTYAQVGSWTQTSVTNPLFSNQADLRFAFVWVQNSANEGVAQDPSFSIDQISVVGTSGGGSAPVANFNMSNTSICAGQCVQLTSTSTGQVDTYQWNVSGGTITGAASANATVCFNSAGTYNVSLTVSNVNGSDTKTINSAITVNSTPVVTVNPASSSLCAGSSTTLTTSGGTTYTWSPNTGLSSTTGSSVIANPNVTTTYTVTGTSSAGCTATAMASVLVSPIPTVSVGNTSICNGQSAPLTASGANTYTWSPNTAINSTTGSQVTVNPTITTTYTVTGLSANGCSATSSSVVTVNNVPTINAPSVTVCAGNPANLAATGADSYSWSPATGLNTTTGANVIANVSQNTTFTVTGVTAAGCAATATAVVTVGATIEITVNSPVICEGASVTLTASGASTYTWSPATDLNQTNGSIVIASPTTSTTYTVTGFNANGCSGEVLSIVAVKPPPTLTPINDSICKGQIANLSVIGANNFTWSPSAGLSATTGNSVQASVAVNSTYVVNGTDANGCTASTQVVAYIYPETTGSISGLNATYFTNSPSSVLTGSPAGGTFSGPGIAGNVFDPAFAGIGTHTITYSFYDVHGCLNTAVSTVTVTAPVGIDELNQNTSSIHIYPNPSSGTSNLIIESSRSEICVLSITDVSGRIIEHHSIQVHVGIQEIAMNIQTAGIYIVHIQNEQHPQVLKWIIE